MTPLIFRDRVHAGKLLADALMKYANRDDVIVLGLPRGGVPVAYEVAKQLHVPLDVIVVRKLGVPGYAELAMGAIASGGIQVVNHAVMRSMGIAGTALEAETTAQLKELHRRELAYRGHTCAPKVEGKIVILVDDGIATGSTIRAAVQALRQQHPEKIIIAVPTAASDTCAGLSPKVDEFIVLLKPEDFRAVGQWYEDFSQTSDAEVRDLLSRPTVLEPV
jgi:putative phosphoribosyl transferase